MSDVLKRRQWRVISRPARESIEQMIVRRTVKWLIEHEVQVFTEDLTNDGSSETIITLENCASIRENVWECILRFRHANGKVAGYVYFVFGQEAWDLVNDWAYPVFWPDSLKKEFEQLQDHLADSSMAKLEALRAFYFNGDPSWKDVDFVTK